jgi:hypothetical protein
VFIVAFLRSHGSIKEMDLEELIGHLEDLTVDVNGNDGNTSKVRAFCV